MEQVSVKEPWSVVIELLKGIQSELQLSNNNPGARSAEASVTRVHVPFRGAEIYLLQKAFIDAGGAPNETYHSLLEKTAAVLANKNQKGFSVDSLQKNSDKVDYEVKENVKRYLSRMIRNIDSY